MINCRCSHNKLAHEMDGLAPQCTAPGCGCIRYAPKDIPRPSMPTIVPPVNGGVAGPETPSGPTADQIIAAGKRSATKRTAALADRIEALLSDLRARVADDTATARLRHEIAELERNLAEKKARLNGQRRQPAKPDEPAEKPATGQYGCPDCDRTFISKQGIGGHRSRAHRRAS